MSIGERGQVAADTTAIRTENEASARRVSDQSTKYFKPNFPLDNAGNAGTPRAPSPPGLIASGGPIKHNPLCALGSRVRSGRGLAGVGFVTALQRNARPARPRRSPRSTVQPACAPRGHMETARRRPVPAAAVSVDLGPSCSIRSPEMPAKSGCGFGRPTDGLRGGGLPIRRKARRTRGDENGATKTLRHENRET